MVYYELTMNYQRNKLIGSVLRYKYNYLQVENPFSRLKTVGADLVAQRKILGVLRDRMDDVGRMATAAAFEAQTVRHKVRSMSM